MKKLIASLLFGLCAVAIGFYKMKDGIQISSDGWAYWEGSVSLLEDLTYRYFGGPPITAFPPLYSIYLAAIQWWTGVSGESLMISNLFLMFFCTLVWFFLSLKTVESGPVRFLWGAYLAVFFSDSLSSLLAENLLMLVLGSFLLIILGNISEKWVFFLSSFLLTLIVLTKNSGLAFIPAGVSFYFFNRARLSPKERLLSAVGVGLIPLCIFFIYRFSISGKGEVHSLDFNGFQSPFTYLQQIINGIAFGLAPLKWGFGYFILVILHLPLCFFLGQVKKMNPIQNRHWISLLVFVWISLFCLWALFNLTSVSDPIFGRFLWYAQLLYIIQFVTLAKEPLNWVKKGVAGLVTLIVVIQAGRTMAHIHHSENPSNLGFIRIKDKIESTHFLMPDIQVGEIRTLSPPNYEWIKRSGPKE